MSTGWPTGERLAELGLEEVRAVAVEGGRVAAVASHDDLGARFPRAQTIAARDCIIIPAFVNAHHHMYGVLAHGIPLDRAPAALVRRRGLRTVLSFEATERVSSGNDERIVNLERM